MEISYSEVETNSKQEVRFRKVQTNIFFESNVLSQKSGTNSFLEFGCFFFFTKIWVIFHVVNTRAVK